jgi:hypothetical protein
MSRFAILTIALFALLAAPARGAGPTPVAGYSSGGAGVTARGLGVRYVTATARPGTVVMAIERRGGAVLQSRYLRGRWFVPTAAYDGAGTGLAATGGTLVLTAERTAYPAAHSAFAVLETTRLRRVATIRLRGDFSLDAISPDGSRLYFIQILSNTRYAVRAYDFSDGKLLRKPVVDPAEPDEPLRGSPMARTLSPDARWAYTLYDGNGTHPFIHALDTARGTAKCIDLDGLAGRDDLINMRLSVAGDGTVLVRDAGRTLYTVNPRTFAVHEPRPAAPARPAPPPRDNNGLGWAGPAAGLALLALLGLFAVRAGGVRFAPMRTRQ